MDESVIVAIITGVLAVVGSYVGNISISRRKAREDAIKDARREQIMMDRLDRLENKVDEQQQDIAVIKTEVEILRKEHKL